MAQWAEELGLGVHTLLHRLGKLGWSVEDAFTTPVQRQARKYASEAIAFNGRTQRLSEWARELGVGYRLLRDRLRRNWTVEAAFTTPSSANLSRGSA